MTEWFKNLGLKKNPFLESFSRPSAFIVGLSKQQGQIKTWSKSERFGTITGDLGTGKTMLLHWTAEELRGQKEHVLLLDGKETRDVLSKAMLSSHLTLLEKGLGTIFRQSSAQQEKELKERVSAKKMCLLIDNAGSLGTRELNLFSDLFFRTKVSMIFVDTPERIKALALPETFVDKLKVRMPEYTGEELKELLTLRIREAGGGQLFDDATLQELVKTTNPGELLEHAQEKAMHLGKQSVPVVKKTGFFTIKIEKKPAAHHKTDHYTAHHHTASSEPPRTAAQERHVDAAMLAKIIDQEPVKVKVQPVEQKHVSLAEAEEELVAVPTTNQIISSEHIKSSSQTKHDKMIAQLMEQSTSKKKPKKR